MNRVYKTFFVFFILLQVFRSFSQPIGIGQWRDQLPYFMVISVTEDDSRIYAATPYALFYFDKEDNSVQRITKISGLSDIGISSISYSKEYKTLVIAYENANIDLIKNNTIINIADIKRAPILGNKTIHHIYFIGKYAYLSTGFGIVVMDIDKEEIYDTYYIGSSGTQVNVLSITKGNNDTLYAATEKGIYMAGANDPNLANYASWKKESRLDTNANYNTIVTFAGEVVVNKHRNSSLGDTIFRYANSHWSPWTMDVNNAISRLESTNSKLTVSFNYFVKLFDQDFTQVTHVFNYFPGNPFPADAILDKDNILWIGDNYSGLVSNDLNKGTFTTINLSGPLTANAFAICSSGNNIYVSPGGRDNSFVPIYNMAQVYHFDNSTWKNYQGGPLNAYRDVVTIAIDPSDPKRIFAGSWGNGLLEIYDGNLVARYGESNSTLKHHSASDTSDIRVGGAAFDHHGALWVVNTHNNKCLSRKSGNNWIGYNIPKANESDLGQLMVDRNDQKWILMRYSNLNANAILVFTDNGTPDNTADDKSKLLNSSPHSGNIPGNTVFAIAEDLKGQVWVGTEKGVGVFYNPENIFVDGQDFDAQQILVQQGSYYQYLLENEMVTAIAVDGNNRKWIGTDRGGLFLFSPEGTTQIYHFTTENSPLFSDRITALAIDPVTGEVFIGTDKGIISFKSTATEGGDTFSDVYAYPNPVKEGYTGYIAIKGLVTDAEVKITDISGKLIFATKALGGQAIWDGRNFDGKHANSGVYLVFASNEDGSEKIVTKILIIN